MPVRTAPCLSLLLAACAGTPMDERRDVHSHARPQQVRVADVALDLELDFDRHEIRGDAILTLVRHDPAAPLVLDAAGLVLEGAFASRTPGDFVGGSREQPAPIATGAAHVHFGAAVTIALPPECDTVRIRYRTAKDAAALQWLAPEQTHDRAAPFLYTQGQAILTRSWIPLQDSPGVRITYTARVRAPAGMTVLMSAQSKGRDADGAFLFAMDKPVPPYLCALACGKLEFSPVGERCGVWAEPGLLAHAARELEDMERMLLACERTFGPYRWGRYDVLVLPPAFPFGGMENPMLTFATPTILAGDKSLVGLIAHELAHSWSGNLVSNATWRDFWLNEGFTVFLENRIMEVVYGEERAAMELLLGLEELETELRDLPPGDQVLHIDLAGRNPDDNMTSVPYEKGAAFLHRLQQVFGRPAFDAFLHGYFEAHAFQSITTADFLAYLDAHLLRRDPQKASQIDVAQWVRGAGLPRDVVRPSNHAFRDLDALRQRWLAQAMPAADLNASAWLPQLWLRFLNGLPDQVDAGKLTDLDHTYRLTATPNCEIFCAWAVVAIRNGIASIDARVEEFLLQVGRRKYLKPIYQALAATTTGRARAVAIYEKARPRYHAVSVRTLDDLLGHTGR